MDYIVAEPGFTGAVVPDLPALAPCETDSILPQGEGRPSPRDGLRFGLGEGPPSQKTDPPPRRDGRVSAGHEPDLTLLDDTNG